MRKLIGNCNRLAVAAVLLLAGSGAALANSIAVPNGTGGGTCASGNPNTVRFAGNCGSLVTIGSGDTTASFVQDNNPSAEAAYNVRFLINLRGLAQGANALGGEMHVFSAYDGADPTPPTVAGNAALRVIVDNAGTGGNPHTIRVEARLDGGSFSSTPSVNLPRGWRSVEIHWTKGAGTGAVAWWLDGNAQTGLSSLANNTETINYVRWGALVIPGGTVGTFKLDDFASQRSGNIGPALPFSDVPTTMPHWIYIQTMYGAEAMPESSIGLFAPFGTVDRKTMSKILLLGRYGSNYVPPSCTATTGAPLGDVACPAHPYADWIYDLRDKGITAGCGGGNFCPDGIIARKDMMVFIYRAKGIDYGAAGGCPGNGVTNTFTGDVPSSASYCPFVNRAATDGLTAGCGGANFCPLTNLARRDIAVFTRNGFAALNPELSIQTAAP